MVNDERNEDKKGVAMYFQDDDETLMFDGKQGRDLWGGQYQYYGYSIYEYDE